VWAILASSSLTLGVAALVLAGALAAAQHQRLYDAVILKTLGARGPGWSRLSASSTS
jgi:putative ABC transport system permease protein